MRNVVTTFYIYIEYSIFDIGLFIIWVFIYYISIQLSFLFFSSKKNNVFFCLMSFHVMSIHVMSLVVDLKHCAFHDIHVSYETLDDAHNTQYSVIELFLN